MEKPLTKSGMLIIILASLAGLFLTYFATNNAIDAHSTKSWPTTEGTIIVSEVTRSSRYVPHIVYTYTIDTLDYTSEKIGLTNYAQYKRESDAKVESDKYPVNSKVTVYYNPNNAEEAILKPGIKGEHILMFSIGLIIFLAPLIGLIYSIRKKNLEV
ncbi:hypothetical protein CYCD_15530 [Tenuifilaceae bacterium CYCD]|nr:hypothetical protein CYCD_15530 [Tenuifilaceae bacterium CYCD]